MGGKESIEEIKKLLRDKRLIIGTENALKKLRIGKLEKIWLSSNVQADVKEDILKYAGMNNANVMQLDVPNDELGVLCKKQFSVSVVSLRKGEK
jgi:ribosomal protein L30E